MYIRDWNEHFKVNKWEYKRKDKIKKKRANYTLSTYSLSKKYFAYLRFKNWHLTHLWSYLLIECCPPIHLPLL